MPSRECSICGLRRGLRAGYLYCISCDPEVLAHGLTLRAGERRDEIVIDFEQIYAELIAEDD